MSAQDIVGVFDDSGAQQFEKARSVRLQVMRDSKSMQHPLEDGSTVVDHRVVLPIEANLLMVLQAEDYRDSYSKMQALFNSGQLLTLQSKTSRYANMYIAAMPHEETSEMLDAVQITISLVEAQFFKSQATASGGGRSPRGSKSATTIKRGEQSAKAAPQSSTAFKLFGG